MSVTKTKWLLRCGLPLAGVVIALLCGRSLVGGIGIVFLTALILVLVVAMPFSFVGIIFLPILLLYGLKFDSRREPDMDLRDPDARLFLFLGVPVTLAIVGLLSIFIRTG